jgi:F-type H+-transporting ATPase subunit epsilon
MARNGFQCAIVTPEREVLSTEATFVALPAHDGEIGILRGRAALLCQLGIGALRVETTEGRQVFYVDRGFAQMVDNRLTVLTEQASRPSEITAQDVEKAFKSASEVPTRGGENVWVDPRLVAFHRAKSLKKIREKYS